MDPLSKPQLTGDFCKGYKQCLDPLWREVAFRHLLINAKGCAYYAPPSVMGPHNKRTLPVASVIHQIQPPLHQIDIAANPIHAS